MRAQVVQANCADVNVVDKDLALRNLDNSKKREGEGGFLGNDERKHQVRAIEEVSRENSTHSSSGPSTDSNLLPRLYIQVDALET